VGVIGLGAMGAPMAANLVGAGFHVVGYNRSEAALGELVRRGGEAASGVADLAARCGLVITMLPDSPDVREVVLGEGAVIDHAQPGTVLIDMSTVDPGLAVEIDVAARQRDIRTLDAPVSGGETGAIQGTLAIMVGGEASVFEDARPVLEAMGTTVVHVGPSGAGQTVKAANQLLVGGHIALLAEAIRFLEASRIQLEPALNVLSGGLAGSRVLERKAPMMAARKFDPSFRAELHHKDMGILLRAARDSNVPLPITASVGQLFSALIAMGGGALDHSALLSVLDSMVGVRGP